MIKQILMLAGWIVLIYLSYRLSVWAIKRYEKHEPKPRSENK